MVSEQQLVINEWVFSVLPCCYYYIITPCIHFFWKIFQITYKPHPTKQNKQTNKQTNKQQKLTNICMFFVSSDKELYFYEIYKNISYEMYQY